MQMRHRGKRDEERKIGNLRTQFACLAEQITLPVQFFSNFSRTILTQRQHPEKFPGLLTLYIFLAESPCPQYGPLASLR
jgi:hypothetical protein